MLMFFCKTIESEKVKHNHFEVDRIWSVEAMYWDSF